MYSLELDSRAEYGGRPGIKFGNIDLIYSRRRYTLLELRAWTQSDRHYRYLDNLTTPESLKYVSTANQVTFDLAKAWLKRCITHHGGCVVQNGGLFFIPSRLLMITKCRDTDAMQVKLYERREVPPTGDGQQFDYVTLSHRWGYARPLKLEESSHQRLKDGIAIDDLPPTYREAIIVTAGLGYSWIWIDSLCIFQDRPQDWGAQARLMGKVYSNCALNLAALDASDCTQGLFSRRNAHSFKPYTIRRRTGDILCVSHMGIYDYGPERGGTHEALPGLLSRGWVVQEVILSPRTLYYCADMLFWECRSCIACERQPRPSKSRPWMYQSQLGKESFKELLGVGDVSHTLIIGNGKSLSSDI